MANGNTNPGIGKNTNPGVMHNPISQGFAQDLVSREGQRPRCPCGGESRAAGTLPLPEAFALRALLMARCDVWDARDAWDDGFLKLAFGASRRI